MFRMVNTKYVAFDIIGIFSEIFVGTPVGDFPTQGTKRKKEESKKDKSWPKHPISDFLLSNARKTLSWEYKSKHFTGKTINVWL